MHKSLFCEIRILLLSNEKRKIHFANNHQILALHYNTPDYIAIKQLIAVPISSSLFCYPVIDLAEADSSYKRWTFSSSFYNASSLSSLTSKFRSFFLAACFSFSLIFFRVPTQPTPQSHSFGYAKGWEWNQLSSPPLKSLSLLQVNSFAQFSAITFFIAHFLIIISSGNCCKCAAQSVVNPCFSISKFYVEFLKLCWICEVPNFQNFCVEFVVNFPALLYLFEESAADSDSDGWEEEVGGDSARGWRIYWEAQALLPCSRCSNQVQP